MITDIKSDNGVPYMDMSFDFEEYAYRNGERIVVDDYQLFIAFPRWLAVVKGIAVPATDKQKMIEAWGSFGQEFKDFWANGEKESVGY